MHSICHDIIRVTKEHRVPQNDRKEMIIMKLTKIFAMAASALVATAVLALNASAYTLDKDLGIFWSANVTVPGSEFADITADSNINITFTVDQSLADVDGQAYWCFKPMINDSGWPFIDGITQLETSEDGSSYVIQPDMTEINFSIPAEDIEHVQLAGIAIIGHGITLDEMTITEGAADAPAADTEAPAAGDDKASPDTGVEGVAAVAGIAALSAGAMLISRKRS